MPLVLLSPPALVSVRDTDGGVLPALLLGVRDDRRFVQVSRGAGANHLCWVGAEQLSEPSGEEEAVVEPVRPATTPARGVPRSLR